jgi:E3 ubiquitin-protein ligase BRE1
VVRGFPEPARPQIFSSRLERAKRKDDVAGANKELEDELDDMRTLLRCSVCHERQKNVIITKCFHMFCKPCIQRNLDTRHRKCPGCGVAFGSQDVKNCFFT